MEMNSVSKFEEKEKDQGRGSEPKRKFEDKEEFQCKNPVGFAGSEPAARGSG